MASRSLILLLLRLRCDNMGQSWRAPRPLLILLSLSSNRLSFGNLGKPLSVVRPTLIKLSDSKLTYSSLRPSICVARALSRFSSSIWKEKSAILFICLLFYIFCRHIITLHFHIYSQEVHVWRDFDASDRAGTSCATSGPSRHIATRQAKLNSHFPTHFIHFFYS